MDESLLYEKRGPLALITLNRPDKLNALTRAMIDGIVSLARQAEHDPDVVAIAVTGQGRGFCSGVDGDVLSQAISGGVAELPDDPDHIPGVFAELLKVSKPIIAAVNGPAAGAGFILAMVSDLRFLAQDALMTTVFSRRGLIAEHNSSWLLPRLVGTSRALDLLWSSRKVGAEEAFRIGLADRVLPAEDLLPAVEAYAADLAAHTSPRALAMIKAQVYRHLSHDLHTAARDTDALLRASLGHPDAREGAQSFFEKRPPRFAAWTGGGQ